MKLVASHLNRGCESTAYYEKLVANGGVLGPRPTELLRGPIKCEEAEPRPVCFSCAGAYSQEPVTELATAWKVGAHRPKVDGEVEPSTPKPIPQLITK